MRKNCFRRGVISKEGPVCAFMLTALPGACRVRRPAAAVVWPMTPPFAGWVGSKGTGERKPRACEITRDTAPVSREAYAAAFMNKPVLLTLCETLTTLFSLDVPGRNRYSFTTYAANE